MARRLDLTLHCNDCKLELGNREILMLAKVPPSITHLAVRKEKGDEVLSKLVKIENPADNKSSRYCPFKLRCRQCNLHVGNVTKVGVEDLICYKIDHVFFRHGHEEIRTRKLKRIQQQLVEIGLPEITVSEALSSVTFSCAQSSKPMIYCDTSELCFRSRELNSLTNQIPRDYQRELFLSALRRNTLVYLPTGSGKTLIAAMVVSCMKELNPQKLMVFLTDRIPLAYQQRDYIKSQCSALKVEVLVGTMDDKRQYRAVRQALQLGEVDVLVLTHQLFLNLLAAQEPVFRMSDISVLVFDEAHHCHGNHPYHQIMRDFYRHTLNRLKPLVLGLTASPAGEVTVERTVDNLQKLLRNMECTVSMPVESKDLVEHSHTPETRYIEVPKSIQQMTLDRFIEDYINYLIEQMEDCKLALKGLPIFSPNFRGALRRLIERCHGNKEQFKALVVGEHAMQMLSVADLSDILGYKHALTRLGDCVYQVKTASAPKEHKLKSIIGSSSNFAELQNLVERANFQNCQFSDKYEKLLHLVWEFASLVQTEETSRGIIFVSMRATAFKVCAQIGSNPLIHQHLNPSPFVGHGQGGYDGMTWTGEQQQVLKKFRSGATKLLVSTSVLEEGLDVPVCNLVIRFEGTATLRALVQSRGRASRKAGGQFVVICNDAKAEIDSKDVVLKETNMMEAIRSLMNNGKPELQASQYECEVKTPDLSFPKEMNSGDIRQVEHYIPSVTVFVRNITKREDQSRVIEFFNQNFEVMSLRDITFVKETAGENATPDLAFELQPNEDSHEFRSKEEFLNHVSALWCRKLTQPDNEPLPIWLQASLTKEPRKPGAHVQLLSAQCMFLGTFMNRTHFRCEWPLQEVLNRVHIFFDHSFRLATVIVGGVYKVEFRYDELEDFFVVDNKGNSTFSRVFLTLRHPPRLYRQSLQGGEEEQQEHQEQAQEQENQENEDDTSDFSEEFEESDSESEGFSTDEEYPDAVRNFHEPSPSNEALLACYERVTWKRVSDITNGTKAWGHCLTLYFDVPSDKWATLLRLSAIMDKRFDKKTFYCQVKVTYGALAELQIPDDLPFDLKYAAAGVLSLYPGTRRAALGRFGSLLQSKSSKIVLAALDKLKKMLEHDKFCNPEDTLQRILCEINPTASEPHKNLVPGHCALIKRAVITPTRLLVYLPEVMVKNRVLRQFDTDKFLCVSIRDEDLSKLSAARGSINSLLDGVKHNLNEGLEIAGQRFLFLGSSNSQLRNHSCWFVRPSPSADDIRRWMGDLSHIRCTALYMARMGQCFSTSLDAVGIGISHGTSYDEEEDIITADKKYCFSDGVGRISEELASEVVKKIGKSFKPSAFQVRFAGYKGVLTLDPSLPGKTASFRPSMRKFESVHRRLEVLQTSRPQVVYLNHQVIMLLSNLGVPDEVFLNLQDDMLHKLSGMLVDEQRSIELLASGAKTGVSYRNLSAAGIPLVTESYFKSLLVAIYRHHIHELLSRARILLPPAEARLMMGVMDEKGVLQPGQVFVQYSAVSTSSEEDEFNKDDKRILKGPVVVTRNPCLHPGDVRQLEAVEALELKHLVDCIVFPRQGLRSHPSEMAGGDLDGDLYFVCWNENLLPRKPNFQPMKYQASPKKEETTPITVADMTTFVISYIRCDQLGVIDNAHKALADSEKDGVESAICLQFAKLHSVAVDAPKTGRWPKMPRMPAIPFPEFMMKTDRESYPSKRVLGKLYRRCRKYKDKASENYSQKTRLDKAFLLPGNEKYIDDARQQYQQYRAQIQGLMGQYGIETEAEVFTGCFLRLRNRLRKEKSDIAELINDLLFALRSDFRAQFFEEFGLSDQRLTSKSQVTEEMRLKASAWYSVAYSDQGPDPLHENKRLLGFPWLVDDVMLAVKQRPTSSAARDEDVCTTVGDSLARLFNEEKAWLLDEFKRRVRAKNSIGRHLNVSSPGLQLVMVGSSATLLLHSRSDLDLCIVPRNATEETGSLQGRQREVLKDLQRHLIEEEIQTPENEENNLFKSGRLVNREKFPVLTCKKPTDKLIRDCQCLSTLVCDLGFYADALTMAILMSNYMKSYPDLLPILRVIHRWGHVTGLSRHTKGAGITSNVLVALLLVQCLRKSLIPNFNQSAIFLKKERLLQGKVTDGELYMEWEHVIRFLEESTTANNSTSLDSRQLGEILMTFFQSNSTSFDREIPDPLASILHVRKVAELLDPEHVVLVKEHMQRAYHYLALYSDVDMMLKVSGSENYSVIFLPPLLSSYIKGLEKSKAQAIAKKTGARSVIIRPRLSKSCSSLILEVKGSYPAIIAVERELERMAAQASRDRVSFMSSCFVKGASVLLFEGSRSVNDGVTLNPYYGAHHPTHDCQILHVPLLRSAHPDGNTFRCFTEKFFSQLQILERDFNAEVHGRYEFVVHFGRIYVFSVPQSLLEDNESLTIALLRANRRIKSMHQSERDVPSEVRYADETGQTRRAKKPFSKNESQNKRKKGKPSRSSFFTVVHSPERVKTFLHSQGFQSDSGVTETYLVDIREDDSEFAVRFDTKLKFKEIKIPNLRWCVADVKRTWIASENPDNDVIEHGELDIRFLLQSRYALDPDDIMGTKYAKYEQILEAGLAGQAFKVKEDLWKHIKLVRFGRTHKFSRSSPGRGSSMDFSVYLDEVTEYSRPAEYSQFKHQSTRWEVTFQPKLPEDLTARTTMKTFLEDVWAFSFALSSFVTTLTTM